MAAKPSRSRRTARRRATPPHNRARHIYTDMCHATYPYSGHLFLFRSKRADYLKCLYWDGSGLCLFAKRLETGKFVWPPIVDGGMVLTPAQLGLLVEAMDWRRTVAPEAPRRPVAV